MFRKDAHGRARVDVNDLVREVLTILDMDFRAQRVLRQVFLNLVINAIEAMHLAPDNARELRIRSDMTKEASNVVVAFEDSGTGVDGKDQDRIFEPFFTTKSAGTGIGLTICRPIIDAHGRSLRVSANKPHGTVFEVVVPVDA
jgi:signal transduction histidine kinase